MGVSIFVRWEECVAAILFCYMCNKLGIVSREAVMLNVHDHTQVDGPTVLVVER